MEVCSIKPGEGKQNLTDCRRQPQMAGGSPGMSLPEAAQHQTHHYKSGQQIEHEEN